MAHIPEPGYPMIAIGVWQPAPWMAARAYCCRQHDKYQHVWAPIGGHTREPLLPGTVVRALCRGPTS